MVQEAMSSTKTPVKFTAFLNTQSRHGKTIVSRIQRFGIRCAVTHVTTRRPSLIAHFDFEMRETRRAQGRDEVDALLQEVELLIRNR